MNGLKIVFTHPEIGKKIQAEVDQGRLLLQPLEGWPLSRADRWCMTRTGRTKISNREDLVSWLTKVLGSQDEAREIVG